MAKAVVGKKGEIVVPEAIGEELVLRPGDRVVFTLEGEDRMVLRPARISPLELEGALRRPGALPASFEKIRRAIRRRGAARR